MRSNAALAALCTLGSSDSKASQTAQAPRSVSKRLRSAFLMILQRFLGERVPLPGGNVAAKLLIPVSFFVLVQPGPQFTQFFSREAAQFLGDFLNSTHK